MKVIMIPFSPENPFPLLEYGVYTYEQAKRHAEDADEWLGFQLNAVEAQISSNDRYRPDANSHGFHTEYWRGLPLQTMQTPYLEIRTILEQLGLGTPAPAGENPLLIDLGCAYGRMALVIGRHYPQIRFIGYEFINERVIEGNRILSKFLNGEPEDVRIEQTDLSAPDFQLPSADFYFLYDFGSRHAIEKTLGDLRQVAAQRTITVIGRGRNSRQIIERGHPWLAEIVPPRHFAGYSIYRSGS